MPSKTDIWMPLYIGDYLADTSHLDATRHGCYLLWMMRYWRKGPLPNDLDDLVASGALRGKDAPSIAQALLNEFFTLADDGLWHQKRQDIEREKWQEKKVKATEKATLAAKSRWGTDAPSIPSSNAQSNAQAMLEPCPLPSPLPLPLPLPIPKNSSPSAHRDKSREKEIIELIFGFYCEKLQKNPKRYQLTDERRKKAGLRFRERVKANDGNEAAVESEFSQVVENLAASDYHVSQGYTDWVAQIFRSQEEFEKRLNWKHHGGNGNGKGNGRHSQSAEDVLRELGAQAGPDSASGQDSARTARQARESRDDEAVGATSNAVLW